MRRGARSGSRGSPAAAYAARRPWSEALSRRLELTTPAQFFTASTLSLTMLELLGRLPTGEGRAVDYVALAVEVPDEAAVEEVGAWRCASSDEADQASRSAFSDASLHAVARSLLLLESRRLARAAGAAPTASSATAPPVSARASQHCRPQQRSLRSHLSVRPQRHDHRCSARQGRGARARSPSAYAARGLNSRLQARLSCRRCRGIQGSYRGDDIPCRDRSAYTIVRCGPTPEPAPCQLPPRPPRPRPRA